VDMDDDALLKGAAADGKREVDALGALEAWLLAEDAYGRGGVPDEVRTYLQDRVGSLLGPQATFAARDFLNQYVDRDGGLARAGPGQVGAA
jgi:hypothetical protein